MIQSAYPYTLIINNVLCTRTNHFNQTDVSLKQSLQPRFDIIINHCGPLHVSLKEPTILNQPRFPYDNYSLQVNPHPLSLSHRERERERGLVPIPGPLQLYHFIMEWDLKSAEVQLATQKYCVHQ